jgi:hypothetical protein
MAHHGTDPSEGLLDVEPLNHLKGSEPRVQILNDKAAPFPAASMPHTGHTHTHTHTHKLVKGDRCRNAMTHTLLFNSMGLMTKEREQNEGIW